MFGRRWCLLTTLKVFDVAVMLAAVGLAIWIPYQQAERGFAFSQFIHMRVEVRNILIVAGIIAAWHLSFAHIGLYRSRRLAARWTEARDVALATLLGTVALVVFAALFSIDVFTFPFLAGFWLASTSFTIAGRLAMRCAIGAARRRGRNLRDLLIVGTNARAFDFARHIDERPELGYRLSGFVDDPRAIPEDLAARGYRLVATLGGFPGYLGKHVVDEVVVSLPVKSLYEKASEIIRLCEAEGVLVRFLSNVFDTALGRVHSDQFDNEPILTISTCSMLGATRLAKRALDISVSLVLLVALAPLAAAVIVVIKLTSEGTAHFCQERLGLHKRTFRVCKFRTMVVGAEAQQAALERLNEVPGPVFKIRNDPRLTPVGRFLRRTSIDELPQLLNVLKGEMSLVGPRPLPVRDYEGFDEDWHRRRFSVRPGITCLWQVNGRSNTSFDRWMEMDMAYVDHWSLWLDVRILAQTIPAVLRGSGAM